MAAVMIEDMTAMHREFVISCSTLFIGNFKGKVNSKSVLSAARYTIFCVQASNVANVKNKSQF